MSWLIYEPLELEGVSIRSPNDKDTKDLSSWLLALSIREDDQGPKLKLWATDVPRFITSARQFAEDKQFGNYVIISEKHLVGLATIFIPDTKVTTTAKIGVMVIPEYEGRYIATKAIKLLLDHGLYTLDFPIIESTSDPLNEKVRNIAREVKAEEMDERAETGNVRYRITKEEAGHLKLQRDEDIKLGENPSEVGENPRKVGDNPPEVGENPSEVGEKPSEE